jgi:hypothetical protein
MMVKDSSNGVPKSFIKAVVEEKIGDYQQRKKNPIYS